MTARKFCDEDLDKAEELRRRGEKWIVVEALLGDGIQAACTHRARAREARNEPSREQFIKVLWQLGVASPWDESQSAFVDPGVNLAWQAVCAMRHQVVGQSSRGSKP